MPTRDLMKAFGWESVESFTQHDITELKTILVDKFEEKLKGTE